MIQNNKLHIALHIALIFVATALGAFNGFLSILSVLVFSDHESTIMWLSIYLPVTLWIIAIICFWFPKSGFLAYAIILVTSIFLCVNPIHRNTSCTAWYGCSDNLRFALLGGTLLFVNIFVPGELVGQTQRIQMKYIKIAGIVWGLIYFTLGAINNFTFNDNASWASVVLVFTLFLLPIIITIIALWIPKTAGRLLLWCVVINVFTISVVVITWHTNSFSDIVQYFVFVVVYNIPHLFFGIAYTPKAMCFRKRTERCLHGR